MQKEKGQLDLPFGADEPNRGDRMSEMASLTARIESARSAEKRKLYRAILSRVAHLLPETTSKPSDDTG